MEYAAFLNSSGGIVTYYDRQYQLNLKVAPYVETVTLPVVSVDSAALYGDHPENLATLTYTSGAALTFFCDSVAGGDDSSGDGSYNNPWRSLKTASRYLSCTSCALNAAAQYVQLKVKGTVDYVSGVWNPFTNDSRLILTGWSEKCDLAINGSAIFAAGYFFNLRVTPYSYDVRACSGCELVNDNGSSSLAVDCEFVSGARVSCAFNCSAEVQGRIVSASVCRGGIYGATIDTLYAYAPLASANIVSGGTNFYSSARMYVRHCAVSAVVSGTAVVSGGTQTAQTFLTGISGVGGSTLLRDCTVDLTASAYCSGTGYVSAAQARAVTVSGVPTITGGALTARAEASAIAPNGAEALAYVYGVDRHATAVGVATNLTASAGAKITGGDSIEWEEEWIYNGSTVCSDVRERSFSGGVATSTYHSSGCAPWN